MRHIMLGAIFLSGLLALPVATSLASPDKRFDEGTQTCRFLTFHNSGWASEGAKIFKQTCKSCHHQGNDKGAPFLHTESKTMKGWNRVFFTRFPECARNGSWDSLTPDQLLAVNDFLFMNAANTYDPNSARDCG